MDNLLTGLNGGNVPALELIFMITLVALLPSIVVAEMTTAPACNASKLPD